ncbi:MAG TPA: ribosome biogenesis GTP-binding protein YihA/YsxC [Candidatus Sumerlaeota bacterium]|nr:MAG: putative GTP-binding protein EngB [candidate division BRC1 bacterium ADurb.BinA292]HOE95968.1 ribosome biogenesis GTP-binding protein YihA/YsxC [Candidatus Sumerlaeota bacterium]HOR27758.1 ribosome biogenesis GTP-binding protein YihA/YsxC [Candidatus Sumerlaeota bacterium]HPK01366.1 ribosome biogenesis GTP-binding protein YihA/YsxC [Candidatus Sumerlaeota bacterium]
MKAEFVKTITDPSQAPPPRPAVVFAGRSNVGKSSLINKLTNRKGLARTSSTPGRTREIQYFGIDDRYYLVDLPGYGYAKVSKTERARWGPMMERFLRKAEGIRLVVLILDVRRDPSPEDLQMIQWLEHGERPYLFAVTKCDKVKRGERSRRLHALQRALGLADGSALVPVSAATGEGIGDLWRVIESVLSPAPPEPKPPA